MVQETVLLPVSELYPQVLPWQLGMSKEKRNLEPMWKSPYPVVLTKLTAAKTASFTPRIHYIQIRRLQKMTDG